MSGLEGKKTYIMLICAVITLLAKKYQIDLGGIDLEAVADDILMLFLALAGITRQSATHREKLLLRTIEYQKAIIQREHTNVK